MANNAPVEVLLIEDDEGDARLVQEAFEQDPSRRVNLVLKHNGAEALDYLRAEKGGRPAIMILDLNLPKYDGRQFLREVKQDPKLNSIPVIVFTTSNAENEIVEAYAARANCYVCKPMNLQGFLAAIQKIGDFWLSVTKLPPR